MNGASWMSVETEVVCPVRLVGVFVFFLRRSPDQYRWPESWGWIGELGLRLPEAITPIVALVVIINVLGAAAAYAIGP